jgi:hypothetical protein
MRAALWALGVALTLVAALVLVQALRDRGAADSHFVFDATEVASVTRFEVSQQSEVTVLIRRGEVWVMLPDSIPVDAERVENALHRVLRLEGGTLVSTSADNVRLREFGLDTENVKRVKWTLASGKTRHILLGNTSSADFNGTYWKHPDQAGVYRTPGNFTHEIPVSPSAWVEIRVSP